MNAGLELLRPLETTRIELPAEVLSSDGAWKFEGLQIETAGSRALEAYLEILGHGLREPFARQCRNILEELRLYTKPSGRMGADPYLAWMGSLIPILQLTLVRGVRRTARPRDALRAIEWIVRNAEIERTGEDWVAVAFAWEDGGVFSVPPAGLEMDDLIQEYLARMARELGL